MLVKTLSCFFIMLLPLSCGLKNETKKKNKGNSVFSEISSEIIIGEYELALSSRLWINLMPTIGEESKPALISSVKLTDKNGKTLPKSLQLKKLYLMQEDKIEESTFFEIKQEESYEIEGISRNNEPTFDFDTSVTIVCEFIYKGKNYRIAAKEQKIEKVY